MEDMTSERKKEILAILVMCKSNIWSHPKGARGGKDCFDDVCEYCGKGVGGKSNTRFVHILTSGLIIPCSIGEDEINALSRENLIDSESQGCFALGSECAKKLLGSEIDKY